MKLTFKSMMKNALIVLSLVFLVAGCKHDPDISQDTYHLVTPTFKAGDVYLLHSYLEGGSGDEMIIIIFLQKMVVLLLLILL